MEKKIKKQIRIYNAECEDCGKQIISLNKKQFEWNKRSHSIGCKKRMALKKKKEAQRLLIKNE